MVEDLIKAKIVFGKGGFSDIGKSSSSKNGGGNGLMDAVRNKKSSGDSGGLAGGASLKLGGKMLKALGTIAATLFVISKSVKALAKASPRLRATMTIFKKSMEMMLRPIGDVLSVYLRPFAIAFLKWAVKYYKDILPKIREFKENWNESPLVKLVQGKDLSTIGKKKGMYESEEPEAYKPNPLGGIQKAIDKVKNWSIWDSSWWDKQWGMVKDWFIDAWADIGTWFDKNIVQPIKNSWKSITDWFDDNIIEPIENSWESIPEWFDDNIIEPIENSWESITSWFNDNIIKPIKNSWKSIPDWFDDNIIDPIENSWKSIPEWFDDNIITPIEDSWESITTWFDDNIITPIKDAWESITDWFDDNIINPIKNFFESLVDSIKDFLEDIPLIGELFESHQTGGYITKEGLYNLHAGETVVPAHMQGVNNNYAPNITINATINNDSDLTELANKVAEITTKGIQRRVSYTF